MIVGSRQKLYGFETRECAACARPLAGDRERFGPGGLCPLVCAAQVAVDAHRPVHVPEWSTGACVERVVVS